jgi:uncharacterized protein (TIGR03382 family)
VTTPSAPASNNRQSWNIDVPGSGPIGPLGVLGAAWLLRRKKAAKGNV